MRAVIPHPQAIAHAVEPGQVGGHFAGKNQVVGGQRIIEVRAVHLHNGGTQGLEVVDRLVELVQHPILVAIPVKLFHHADAHPGQIPPGALAGSSNDGGHRPVHAGGVVRVGTSDDLVQQCGVEHSAGGRTALVQRGCARHQAIPGYRTVGRLDPHGAGERRRLANRPAGVGADRQGCLPGC